MSPKYFEVFKTLQNFASNAFLKKVTSRFFKNPMAFKTSSVGFENSPDANFFLRKAVDKQIRGVMTSVSNSCMRLNSSIKKHNSHEIRKTRIVNICYLGAEIFQQQKISVCDFILIHPLVVIYVVNCMLTMKNHTILCN
jgi:hypothetical protein